MEKTKPASSIGPNEKKSITQSDVIKYHKLWWTEKFGPKYKFIYEETSEYMQFVDSDDLTEEDIIMEILKLYLKSNENGEYHDVIKNIQKDIESNLKNIRRLKQGSDKSSFLCRLESFTDNILYGIK